MPILIPYLIVQKMLPIAIVHPKQAGTELGKAQPKLRLGKSVADLYDFGQ